MKSVIENKFKKWEGRSQVPAVKLKKSDNNVVKQMRQKFEQVICKEGRNEAEIERERKRREFEGLMNTFGGKKKNIKTENGLEKGKTSDSMKLKENRRVREVIKKLKTSEREDTSRSEREKVKEREEGTREILGPDLKILRKV